MQMVKIKYKENKMTDKIDLKKEMKPLYNPSKKEPAIVEVPRMNYLMVDGHGDPNNNPLFQDAVSSLYPLAYGLKFAVKKQQGINYGVMPLQGLWWTENMEEFSENDKSNWDWTVMIMQPEWVTEALVEEIRTQVKAKKNPPLIDKIRFETYTEGTVVTLLHIGPFADEGPNIARMHAFAEAQGFELAGKHHEIYLSDFSKTAPERMRIVLRQPIRRAN
jgi:hypothetical protein